MKDLKESNPMDVEEYATARGVEYKPSFSWWLPHTLRKRDVIVAAVSLSVHKCSHKYRIELPIPVAESRRIDQKNGNTFWVDAIHREMDNVGVHFALLPLLT